MLDVVACSLQVGNLGNVLTGGLSLEHPSWHQLGCVTKPFGMEKKTCWLAEQIAQSRLRNCLHISLLVSWHGGDPFCYEFCASDLLSMIAHLTFNQSWDGQRTRRLSEARHRYGLS